MILVTGSVHIHPEHRAQALELAIWMQQQTRTEPGCLEYTFSADLEQEALIHVTERWDSLESLQRHFQTAHMAQFNAQLPNYLLAKPVVTRHTVSDSAAL
jgi:quinol monooxygenase YgiN